jgi:hypothetical protein
MNTRQRNTALVAAIAAGLASLPLTWMTIQNVSFQGGLGYSFNFLFGSMNLDVTALNGHVTLLVKTPLWFVVCIAIGASVVQLMKNSRSFEIPNMVEWIVAIVANIWTIVPMGMVVLSGKAGLGIGALLGLSCALTPLVCLVMTDNKRPGDEQHYRDEPTVANTP